MIRAIRPNAMAQDDASLVSGWNIAPNVAYTLTLLPGSSSCGVFLFDQGGTTLIASGATLVGTDQPCVLTPQSDQTVEMVDADLGWHLLLTTAGTESQRTIRIGPAVDLPDEIHPIYGDDGMALARATAAIDAAAHYIDDVTVTCPLGLGAGLGAVVSVPVDGAAVVGQVESITWTATPEGTTEQAMIRRHVAIAPEPFVEITPPTVADDTWTATHTTGASGNVLTNDATGLTVVAVAGLSSNVGVAVDGSNGGVFTVGADGEWSFDPGGDFDTLTGDDTATTSVTYHVSDGTTEASATLTVTVSSGAAPELWTPAEITAALWLDASDADSLTLVSGKVSQWADKSGNARHATQSTDTNRPTLETNRLVFAGDDYMSVADAAGLQFGTGDFAAVAVANITNVSKGSTAQNTLLSKNYFGFELYNYQGTLGGYVGGTGGATQISGLTSGAWGIFSQIRASSSHTVRRTGTASTAVTNTADASQDGQALLIGVRPGLVTKHFFIGKASEIIVLPPGFTAATIELIEGYLAHKWDTLLGVTTLVDTLPSGHPYKSAPPTV